MFKVVNIHCSFFNNNHLVYKQTLGYEFAWNVVDKVFGLVKGVANGKCETLQDGETSVFLCKPEAL